MFQLAEENQEYQCRRLTGQQFRTTLDRRSDHDRQPELAVQGATSVSEDEIVYVSPPPATFPRVFPGL